MKHFKLSEIMDVIGDGTPKIKVSEYWGGNIPWLSVVDFSNDQKKFSRPRKPLLNMA